MSDAEQLNKEHTQLATDYLVTFSTPEGERVLQDLQAAYGDRISFSSDPYATAYKEGQRSVLLRINNLLKERKDEG
ncbi:MAG: hypothetical protein GOVbin3393_14 [Prokaryotic dsDNA virus sp.]|nr:MAG: hypothetical protein GOVbin3393_14 [Prokaryotic dsDNA virus sp.]|tara:strand:- start:385 stop:612 length:228 start_codon:yes stop_codon:yes gene_type:complete